MSANNEKFEYLMKRIRKRALELHDAATRIDPCELVKPAHELYALAIDRVNDEICRMWREDNAFPCPPDRIRSERFDQARYDALCRKYHDICRALPGEMWYPIARIYEAEAMRLKEAPGSDPQRIHDLDELAAIFYDEVWNLATRRIIDLEDEGKTISLKDNPSLPLPYVDRMAALALNPAELEFVKNPDLDTCVFALQADKEDTIQKGSRYDAVKFVPDALLGEIAGKYEEFKELCEGEMARRQAAQAKPEKPKHSGPRM